jgi:hypothetical protein
MQPLINKIKNTSDLNVSFGNLVNVFADFPPVVPEINLQNFLTQIKLTAENNNSSYDTAGILISVMT